MRRTVDRRELLELAAAAAVTTACQSKTEEEYPVSVSKMPVLFIGHGSPMNAIEDNVWSRGFVAIGKELPRPRAVLAVSAHWWTKGSYLTGASQPRTIHDFGGFPAELQEVQYPAPGSPDLAARVTSLLSEAGAALSQDWGLDHGTWSVLKHLIPAADVPVVQLSLDGRRTAKEHFELARALHQLRGEGVLVVGSGNVTHNLRDAMSRSSQAEAETPEWAARFDRDVASALTERDTRHLIAAWPDGPDASKVHPHPDHWFPLLYAYAATDESDTVRFPIEGFDLGSLSMRAVRWG